MITDKELIDRVKTKDGDAFYELYQRYEKSVKRWVSSYVLGFSFDFGTVEDICVDVWDKVWSNPSFDGKSAFGTWLYAICKTTSRDYIHKIQREQKLRINIGTVKKDDYNEEESTQLYTLIDDGAPETDEGDAVTAKELAEDIFDIMNLSLTERQYGFLRLYFLGWRVKDIAEFFKTNEDNVSVTLNQAKPRIGSEIHKVHSYTYTSNELNLCMEYLAELLIPSPQSRKGGI